MAVCSAMLAMFTLFSLVVGIVCSGNLPGEKLCNPVYNMGRITWTWTWTLVLRLLGDYVLMLMLILCIRGQEIDQLSGCCVNDLAILGMYCFPTKSRNLAEIAVQVPQPGCYLLWTPSKSRLLLVNIAFHFLSSYTIAQRTSNLKSCKEYNSHYHVPTRCTW